jgi:hypothetical protein
VKDNPYGGIIRSTAIDCGYEYVFSYGKSGQALAGNNEKRICSDGACVIKMACTDDYTDADPGAVYHKGTVKLIVMGKETVKRDFCADRKSLDAKEVPTSKYVAEYGCTTKQIAPYDQKEAKVVTVMECPAGTSCFDGACVKQ